MELREKEARRRGRNEFFCLPRGRKKASAREERGCSLSFSLPRSLKNAGKKTNTTHLNFSRNSDSVYPSVYSPKSSGFSARIDVGTVASISSSREEKPRAATISASSEGVSELWRGENLWLVWFGFSRFLEEEVKSEKRKEEVESSLSAVGENRAGGEKTPTMLVRSKGPASSDGVI